VASRAVGCWIAVAVGVAGSTPAAAEPAFSWSAPASCPTAADVRARIEQRLGASIDGTVHGIEIAIAREGAAFVARVDLRGITVANDVRTLRAARCDELASAIAVIIARLSSEARQTGAEVDTAFEVPEVGERAPASGAELDDLSRAPHPIDRGRPAAPGHRWGGGVRALGLSGVGAQPGVSLGGELAVYLRRADYVGELAYATWSATPAVLRYGAAGHVEVGLDVAIVRAGWGPERLPLRAWVSGEVGTLHGQGISVDDPRGGTGRWIAIGTGFAVGWPIAERARVVGLFEIAVPVSRATFMLTSGSQDYAPAPATARCALGFEVGWR
jgi:hypothetical protein